MGLSEDMPVILAGERTERPALWGCQKTCLLSWLVKELSVQPFGVVRRHAALAAGKGFFVSVFSVVFCCNFCSVFIQVSKMFQEISLCNCVHAHSTYYSLLNLEYYSLQL